MLRDADELQVRHCNKPLSCRFPVEVHAAQLCQGCVLSVCRGVVKTAFAAGWQEPWRAMLKLQRA